MHAVAAQARKVRAARAARATVPASRLSASSAVCVCLCVCVCVCVCERACVRACMRACVRACAARDPPLAPSSRSLVSLAPLARSSCSLLMLAPLAPAPSCRSLGVPPLAPSCRSLLSLLPSNNPSPSPSLRRIRSPCAAARIVVRRREPACVTCDNVACGARRVRVVRTLMLHGARDAGMIRRCLGDSFGWQTREVREGRVPS